MTKAQLQEGGFNIVGSFTDSNLPLYIQFPLSESVKEYVMKIQATLPVSDSVEGYFGPSGTLIHTDVFFNLTNNSIDDRFVVSAIDDVIFQDNGVWQGVDGVSYQERYTFSTEGGEYQFHLETLEAEAEMELLDASSGERIAFVGEVERSGLLGANVAAGQYTLILSNTNGSTTPYSLIVTSKTSAGAGIGRSGATATQVGQWKSSGGQDHLSPFNGRHPLVVGQAAIVEIDLTADFPTRLYLLDAEDRILAQSSGDTGTLSKNLSAGAYTIVAATESPDESGEYELSVSGESIEVGLSTTANQLVMEGDWSEFSDVPERALFLLEFSGDSARLDLYLELSDSGQAKSQLQVLDRKGEVRYSSEYGVKTQLTGVELGGPSVGFDGPDPIISYQERDKKAFYLKLANSTQVPDEGRFKLSVISDQAVQLTKATRRIDGSGAHSLIDKRALEAGDVVKHGYLLEVHSAGDFRFIFTTSTPDVGGNIVSDSAILLFRDDELVQTLSTNKERPHYGGDINEKVTLDEGTYRVLWGSLAAEITSVHHAMTVSSAAKFSFDRGISVVNNFWIQGANVNTRTVREQSYHFKSGGGQYEFELKNQTDDEVCVTVKTQSNKDWVAGKCGVGGATLTTELDAGDYLIEPTRREEAVRTPYELLVTADAFVRLTYYQRQLGIWDKASVVKNFQFKEGEHHQYLLQLHNPGDVYIYLTRGEEYKRLAIFDKDGDLIEEGDLGGCNYYYYYCNEYLSARLDKGVYFIRSGPRYRSSTAAFELEVRHATAPFDFGNQGAYKKDNWSENYFYVKEESVYVLQANSSDYVTDVGLELKDEQGSILSTNDDISQINKNARIVRKLQPGLYSVRILGMEWFDPLQDLIIYNDSSSAQTTGLYEYKRSFSVSTEDMDSSGVISKSVSFRDEQQYRIIVEPGEFRGSVSIRNSRGVTEESASIDSSDVVVLTYDARNYYRSHSIRLQLDEGNADSVNIHILSDDYEL